MAAEHSIWKKVHGEITNDPSAVASKQVAQAVLKVGMEAKGVAKPERVTEKKPREMKERKVEGIPAKVSEGTVAPRKVLEEAHKAVRARKVLDQAPAKVVEAMPVPGKVLAQADSVPERGKVAQSAPALGSAQSAS